MSKPVRRQMREAWGKAQHRHAEQVFESGWDAAYDKIRVSIATPLEPLRIRIYLVIKSETPAGLQ